MLSFFVERAPKGCKPLYKGQFVLYSELPICDFLFRRKDTKGCFNCLKEVSKSVDLRPAKRDFFDEFVTSARSLLLETRDVDLTPRPSCPSMEAFRRQVLEWASPSEGGQEGVVRWRRSDAWERAGSGGSDGGSHSSPDVAYVIRTKWEYAVIRASELPEKQV